ncbi:hypothetical protein C8Q79DRAFT_950812 [Trametes meyenii]|nr:hypothetical protein C8Q79DRAFT_950812 [Trametes meyenii]
MASIVPSVSRNAFKRALVRPSTSALTAAPRFYSSTMHDNDPEVPEEEKRRNLSKLQHETSTPIPDQAPGWNQYLASASEAAIKADQSTGTPLELQERTVKYVKERHHRGDSSATSQSPVEPGVSTSHMKHDGPTDPEAPYSRDEIDGPLKSAHPATSQEKKT